MVRRLTRVPRFGQRALLNTTDRVINRYWDYPRWLRSQIDRFDLFHIVDHSYAHLASTLPAGRSIVTCHDVDAFAGVLPGVAPPSTVSRAMGRRLLAGLRAAARVVCGSGATRDALLAHGLVDESRVLVVPYAVHPAFAHEPDRPAEAEAVTVVRPVRGWRTRHPARRQHHSPQAHRRAAGHFRRRAAPIPGCAAPAGRWTVDDRTVAAGRAARRGWRDRGAAVPRSPDTCRRLPARRPGPAAVRTRGLRPAGHRGPGVRHARSGQRHPAATGGRRVAALPTAGRPTSMRGRRRCTRSSTSARTTRWPGRGGALRPSRTPAGSPWPPMREQSRRSTLVYCRARSSGRWPWRDRADGP